MVYNLGLVSGVQQGDSVICLCISTLLRFFSHAGHHKVSSRVPWLYSRSLLVIYFLYYIYVCVSVPLFQFIPFPQSTLEWDLFQSIQLTSQVENCLLLPLSGYRDRDSWESTCHQVNCFASDVSAQVQLWKFRFLCLQVLSLHLTFRLFHWGL